MAGGRITREHNPSNGGVPTPGARRARVATGSVAVLLADALAVYAALRGDGPATLVVIAGAAGLAFVLAALLAAWDDGLTVGPVLLLLAYVLSLADGDVEPDPAAPLFGVGLLAVVEFGAWSLELRDGAEERPLARLPRLAVLLVAAAAVGTIVLAVSSLRIEAGLALWALGAGAAIGLLLLLAHARTPSATS